MKTTRRGFFGMVAGAVAAALAPKPLLALGLPRQGFHYAVIVADDVVETGVVSETDYRILLDRWTMYSKESNSIVDIWKYTPKSEIC